MAKLLGHYVLPAAAGLLASVMSFLLQPGFHGRSPRLCAWAGRVSTEAALAAMCYNPVSQPQGVSMARELLTEAIAMYRQIGMPKHVEMAETMLGEV